MNTESMVIAIKTEKFTQHAYPWYWLYFYTRFEVLNRKVLSIPILSFCRIDLFASQNSCEVKLTVLKATLTSTLCRQGKTKSFGHSMNLNSLPNNYPTCILVMRRRQLRTEQLDKTPLCMFQQLEPFYWATRTILLSLRPDSA